MQGLINEADRILRRNGIKGVINFHVYSNLKNAQGLPGGFRWYDRSLYLELVHKGLHSLGSSNNNFPDKGVLFRDFTRVEILTAQQSYPSNWRYMVGLIMAHEFAHQLDAFALFAKEGSYEGRGHEGHYWMEDRLNLLTPGQLFENNKEKGILIKSGQPHELLPPEVRERILNHE